jgi:hypothetical protein
MQTLRDAEVRAHVSARIAQLRESSAPAWGTFTSAGMLAHCVDAFRIAMGELPCKPIKVPFGHTRALRWFVLRVLPFPKNAPTAPEMIQRAPRAFEVEREALLALVARFAPGAGPSRWSPHPLFGNLSEAEWSELAYKHLNHHLRQFGV